MKYEFVDYRTLVTMWFNEFLPDVTGDSAQFINDIDLTYMLYISLEPKKVDSIKFLARKVIESTKKDVIRVFVQEPRPVNNPRITPLLRFIEKNKSVDENHLHDILHLANKRYRIFSTGVVLPQDKEMCEFLDQVFLVMQKLNLQNTRFYASNSLCFNDVASVAKKFFPSKLLSVDYNVNRNVPIVVDSSNLFLELVSEKLMENYKIDSQTMDFIDSLSKSVASDFERIVI